MGNRIATDRSPARTRERRLTWIMLIYCVALSLMVVLVVLFPPPPYDIWRPDFGVFWVVSTMVPETVDKIYDPEAVTEAQAFIADPEMGLLPWVYPPTALALVLPFGNLPFWTAFGLWVGFSTLLYLAATKWAADARWEVLLLIVASFSFWSGARAGQLSPAIAALIIFGLSMLTRRPIVAGLLLAFAGLVKPSLLAMAPVVLLAGGHWHAFLSAGVATIAAVAATLIAFGPEIWWAWFAAVRSFPEIQAEVGIETHSVTFLSLLETLGVESTSRLILQIVAGLAGVALAAEIFRRRDDLPAHLVGLVGCGLLVTPYAMKYDLIVLLPVAGWLMVRRKQTAVDWWLALTSMALFFPIPPFAGLFPVLFVLSAGLAAIAAPRGAGWPREWRGLAHPQRR